MKKNSALILGSFLISLSFISTGCEKMDSISLNNKQKEKQIALSKEKSNTIDLKLYFNTSKDALKPDIVKQERVLKKDEILGQLIMTELIKGPSLKSDLSPILPKETRLLSFSIKDNIAFINLSKEANVSMSPPKEQACLKSIVWSLTEVETIKKVKISVENKDVNLWGNYYDLTKPIGRDDLTNEVKN